MAAEAPVYRGGLYTGPSAPSQYAGGVVPYERGNVRVGPGWVGNVRVGYRGPPGLRAHNMRPGAAAARGGGQASAANPNAAPIPPGYYNPERDFVAQAGKQKVEGLEGNDALGLARAGTDYYTQLGQLGRREAERRQNSERAKAALKRQYGILKGRQEEGANRAGVLQSGALIQAAAKRSANEGLAQGEQQTALERGLTSDREAREKLALDLAPPVTGDSWSQIAAGTSGAGRRIVDMARALLSGQAEQSGLEQNTDTAKAYEAGQLGYEPPEPAKAPAKPAARTKAAVQRAVANPRYLNRASGRLETARQLRTYRRR